MNKIIGHQRICLFWNWKPLANTVIDCSCFGKFCSSQFVDKLVKAAPIYYVPKDLKLVKAAPEC